MTEPTAQPWTFDHAIVGASDVSATVAFFAAFGFDPIETSAVDRQAADLLGVQPGAESVMLGVEGASGGRIRVIETSNPTSPFDAYSPRAEALDIYTTDMAASLEVATDAGAATGPVADYSIGPISLKQVIVHGPDDVALCLVEIPHRLPSVLDSDPGRLHSELHSLVCVVEDDALDAATDFWGETAGLTVRSRFPIDVPEVSEFMGLPEHTPCRMSVLSNQPDAAPPRFELLAFDRPAGSSPRRPSLPLEPGASVPAFTVTDISVASGTLHEPRIGERLSVGIVPGGSEIALLTPATEKV